MGTILLFLRFAQISSQAAIPDSIQHNSQSRLPKDNLKKINENFIDQINQLNPTGTGNEISGCTFTNVVNSGINNFIKAQGQTLFYNNVIQSDKYYADQPGIIWLNANINFALVNCSFINHNTRAPDDGIILTVNEQDGPTVTFESCKFIDCSNDPSKSLVKFKNDKPKVNFTDCLFTFSNQNTACHAFYSKGPNAIFDRCNFSGCGPESILIEISNSNIEGQFQFTKNDVKTVRDNFITIGNSKASIELNDNTFTDVTLENKYFIHIQHKLGSLNVKRNTFSHFTTRGSTELNGGGIAVLFQGPQSATSSTVSLTYDHCTFIDIKNERVTGSSSYGGSIQFGYGNYLTSLKLVISNCVFKENKAYKHGGALAIQTEQTVTLKNCTFENNVAQTQTTKNSAFNLLDEKVEGRGGAVFLNPVFTASSRTRKMMSATIEDCKFVQNVAFGGYAIYIDGNSDTTTFTVTGNKFFNNYAGNDAEQCTHGAIDSESLIIVASKIESENDFSTVEHGSGSKIFVHVDNLGNVLPDPTATPKATQLPTPAPIEGTDTNYIDKYFEGQNYTDQIKLGNDNIKQISGCTFKNILKPDAKPNMNNFIYVAKKASFFNNIIENDEIKKDQPGVFWLDSDIVFTISHCKFIRVTHRESSEDACILTVDYNNHPTVTFESCEFIDCAYTTTNSQSLVKLKNKDPTITFTDCTITFSEASCQVVQAMNPQVVFERCQFSGCPSKAINLESIPSDSTSTGKFKFTENIVKKQTGNLIYIKNLKSVPEINNNLFEDIKLGTDYMIYIENNQYKFTLSYNIFSKITSSSDSESRGGGLSFYMPSSAKLSATSAMEITYNNCHFYDIKNLKSKKPYYQGGAIQCGFDQNLCNLNLIITNCIFKGNQAFKHGGALAVQIQGSLTIRNTTFEENRANMKSSNLLAFDDYTELKEEGRGGAIYLNPTFAIEGDSEKNMVNVIIDNCTFKRNVAFDGYAIYIEGQNGANTKYQITNNFFINNYNGLESSTGGVFVTEITQITENQIINNNVFSNKENGIDALNFTYVDHYGIPFPDPTKSPLPTNYDGSNSEIWKQEEHEEKKRVDEEKDPENDSHKNVVLKVEATKFEDMHELNGSAIHLVNCGLECTNKCEFINLGNEKSVGGAIYINNPNEMKNSVSLDGLTFKQCKADYGGAIFIHSSSLENIVSIKSCIFEGNIAAEKDDVNDEFSGGSAIFLSSQRGIIILCKFKENVGPGGSVKIHQNFQNQGQNTDSMLLQMNPKIEVSNCLFNDADSSIFFVAGNSDSQVEINNCLFTSKMTQNRHHIDGIVVDKMTSKLIVKSCKFVDEGIEKVVDTKVLFNVEVDEKSLVFGYNENESKSDKNASCLWKWAACLAAPALIAVVALLVAKKLKKSDDSVQNEEQLNLMNDESVVSEATI